MNFKQKVLAISLLIASSSVLGIQWGNSFSSVKSEDDIEQSVENTQAPVAVMPQAPQRTELKSAMPKAADIVKGVVRVKLSEDGQVEVQRAMGKKTGLTTRSASSAVKTGVKSLDRKLLTYKASSMTRVFPYHPKYEARQREMGLHQWYKIEIDENVLVSEVCKELGLDPAVLMAEPVLKTAPMQVDRKQSVGGQSVGTTRVDGRQESNFPVIAPLSGMNDGMSILPARRTPFTRSGEQYEKNPPTNDSKLLEQWHYYNYGQVSIVGYGESTPGADIRLFDAWKITMGSKDVIVSVHDHGIDYRHPDLVENMWVNKAEAEGKSGVDDDGNGYVDDVYGFNFISNTANLDYGSGHGTHVAGTISAVNNNGIGVAGVAGGSGKGDGTRLMSCEIIVPEGATADIAASYVYAANNGAVISQNSWGYTSPDVFEQSVLDGIDYFIKYAGKDEKGSPLPGTRMIGGMVIFAAGNDGQNLDIKHYYPGYYDPCIVVSATGPQNEQMSYTNYGKRTDITAPGGNTYVGQPTGVLSTYPNGEYYNLQGTSMACPHVSGVAALILAKFGHKGYTNDMLKNRLLFGVTPWSQINPSYVGIMGSGLLNAAKALEPDDQIAPEVIADVVAKGIGFDFLTIEFTAPVDKDNKNASSYEVGYSEEMITEENFAKALTVYQMAKAAGETEEVMIDLLKGATTYYVAVHAYDMWGNKSKISNVITVTTKTAPSIQTPKDTLRLSVMTAGTTPEVSEYFKIGNTTGGDLRFQLDYAFNNEPRFVRNGYKQRLSNINTEAGRYDATFGSDGTERFLAASQFTVKSEAFTVSRVISPVIPHVKYPDGLVEFSRDTIVLKIYKGGDVPTKGDLISTTQYIIPYAVYASAFQNNIMMDLSFDLNFPVRVEKEEKFWVVFDFKKRFHQPMGINVKTTAAPKGELYSTDNQVWNQLSSVAVGDLEPNYAFRIFADDQFTMPMKNVISLLPLSGNVVAGAQKDIQVKANSKQLIEGKYTGFVYVKNNTPGKNLVEVPFRLDVAGHRSGLVSKKVLTLRSTVQGYTDSARLVVRNDSLGWLEIAKIESSLPEFTIKPNQNIKVAPQDSMAIWVYFTAPKEDGKSGAYTSRIAFTSNVGHDYTVVAEAVSVQRPVITMSKASEELTLGLKEDGFVEFTIKNDGASRLEYEVGYDRVSDYDYYDVQEGVYHYYGKKQKLGKWDFESIDPQSQNYAGGFNPAFAGAEEITGKINGATLYHIDLPFVFSSYDVDYRSLTVTGDGRIMLGKRDVFEYCRQYIGRNRDGVNPPAIPATIFPLNFQKTYMVTAIGGKAWMKKADDHIIFEYTKMGVTYGDGNTSAPVRVQVTLRVDGTITLAYTDYNITGVKDGLDDLAAVIAISDATGDGGLGIWSTYDEGIRPGFRMVADLPINGFGRGLVVWEEVDGVIKYDTLSWTKYPGILNRGETIKIDVTPNQTFVKNIENGKGSLLPGETAAVRLTVRVDKEMAEGKISKILPIATNDPLNQDASFGLTINYQSEALPKVERSEVDMGAVGKGITRTTGVILNNFGGKNFDVKAHMKSGTHVKVTPVATNQVCRALSSLAYTVAFTPTEEKEYDDYLIFEFDEAETGMKEMQVLIKGRGTKTPKAEVVTESKDLYFTVDKRKNERYADTVLTVKNTGDATLKYNLLLPGWLKDVTPATRSGFDQFGYYWTDNLIDTSGVSYDWIEIAPDTVADINPIIDGKLYPSAQIDLPFEFDFYGEKFKTIRVDRSGAITFVVLDCHYTLDGNIKGSGDLQFPVQDVANGIIGGLIGRYGAIQVTYEAVGKGDDTKFVVTFDLKMAKLQTILYKDGRIKFQYKDVQRADQGFLKEWLNKVTIGMENRTGTDGFMISYNTPENVQNYRAIMITPCKQRILEPGQSQTFRLRADMSDVWDGKFLGNALVVSNDEKNRIDTTRFHLNVIGKSGLEYYVDGVKTKVLDFGKVDRTAYPTAHKEGYGSLSYVQDFGLVTKKVTIRNAGTRKVILFKSEQKNDIKKQLYDPEFTYPLRSSLPNNLYLEPNQSIEVTLGFYTGLQYPQSGLDSLIRIGKNEVIYRVRDKIFDAEKAAEQGFTANDWEQHGWDPTNPGMGGQKPYFYQEDTLIFKYELVDVPTETIKTTEKVIERAYAERTGEETVSFTIENTQKSEDHWMNMFDKTQYNIATPKVEAQGSLDYEIVLDEISENAYENLKNPEKAEVEKVALKKRLSNTKVLIANGLNVISSLLQTPITRAANESAKLIDSLGNWGKAGYGNGYFSVSPSAKFKNHARMKTGKEGFNITHLRAFMAKLPNVPQLGYDVEVRISIGKNLLESEEIYTEVFTPDIKVEGKFNYVTTKLKKEIYIYPETYVWITYVNNFNTTVAAIWWAMLDYTLELEESFMGDNGKEFGYVSALTNTWGGWDIAAFSEKKKENVESWYKLSETNGSIAAGDSKKIDFTFSVAKDASEFPTRYAKISLKTNDTYPFGADTTMRSGLLFTNPETNEENVLDFGKSARSKDILLVKLAVNQGPKVSTTYEYYTLQEIVDSTLLVRVLDKEKDAITKLEFRQESAVGLDSIHGVVPVITYGVPTHLGDTLVYPVTLALGYESSASYVYRVVATDAKGKEGYCDIKVNVANTNRKPIVIGKGMSEISSGDFKTINLNTVFSDPDRQLLFYSAESQNGDVLAVTVTDSLMTLNGWKEGNGVVKITASDSERASVTLNYGVKVGKEQLKSSTTQVTLFPNPTVSDLYCRFALKKRADVQFRVFGMDGKLCYESEKLSFGAGDQEYIMNVTQLADGNTYILQYVVDGEAKSVKQFIKTN